MARFIEVHEDSYNHVYETMINVNQIAYIQESHNVKNNNAIIGINGDTIYVTETVKELRALINKATLKE